MPDHGYLHGLRFLIIDDSSFMRELLREVLHHFDVRTIREASDGAAALEIMMAWTPDIILADWEMTPFDGIEFTRAVRSSTRGEERFVPIVVVSAHSEYWRIQHARNAGVNEFLVKPLSPTAMFSRIRAVIERPRPFIKVSGYFGPDRRRQDINISDDRRKEQRDMAPIRAETMIQQDQINSIFNPGSEHPDDQHAQVVENKTAPIT
ncbi:MAG: response regulator [Magnetovibrio sp.]|nr:response regulator [Magnetovibrio sp.]